MKEEIVTKAILEFLRNKGYRIVSFDFPQSGTGLLLHPDTRKDKNEGIKPDIIASKGNILIIMENKDRYWKQDFEKLHELKTSRSYEQSLNDLHTDCKTSILKVGIGIPENKTTVAKALEAKHLVDFIVVVDKNEKCKVMYGEL